MDKEKRSFLSTSGLEGFNRGTFVNGGDNLYVNANGVMETIHRTDLNSDGFVDIVLPNGQGDNERGPTWIYKQNGMDGKNWPRKQLPNDSGWTSRAADIDNDGYLDLLVVNAENGVTSELDSYIYWGGPDGLTGERTELPTKGAYNAALYDLTGNGLLDIIFPSAWLDHHIQGREMTMTVYLQQSARSFDDKSEEYGLKGYTTRGIVCEDLNKNGYPDIVLANYTKGMDPATDSYIYFGSENGFDTGDPLRLPTRNALNVFTGDLNDDGYKEVLICGGGEIRIFWNAAGVFSPDNLTILKGGSSTREDVEDFAVGELNAWVSDVDNDGRNELIIAHGEGVEIRRSDNIFKASVFLKNKSSKSVKTADLNNDGYPEIIVSSHTGSGGFTYESLSCIFWNSADGFDPERKTLLPTSGAVGCEVGDFDGDGIPEVVFNSTMVGYNRGWSGFPAYLYYGNKNNEYAVDNRVELPTGGGGADYVIADMDLDGYPDLLFVTWDGCRIFRGGPGGPNSNDYIDVFKKSTSFIYNIYVADFNRDGWLDILMVAYSGNDKPETLNNSTFIHFGSPEGFSDENTQLLPTYSMGFAQLADIDNDGWLDIIYGDKRGYIGIYKGGPEGYSTDRLIKIPLDLAGKVPIRNINTADINNDGWLDLVVGLKGHWLRESSGYYILYSDKGNFDQKDAEFHMTEASPGGISFSDLNNDGHLDMMVSAYSTAYTRELPTFIYYGKDGTFDFENPLIFKCNASVAFNTVDITGNGYPDLLIGCHRSDPGHIVESMLYFNGPGGLGKQDPVLIPGMGPHGLSARDFGNAKDRSSKEYYESQVYDISSSVPVSISWKSIEYKDARLMFQIRYSLDQYDIKDMEWTGPSGPDSYYMRSGEKISGIPEDARNLQYRAIFSYGNGCSSPKLSEVIIETIQKTGR